MAGNKTIPTDASVQKFLATLDEQQRRDSEMLIEIMQSVSGEPPVMWGSSIVGFGQYHYKYASGREGDTLKIGFSPRKGKMTLYTNHAAEQFKSELDQIGKHDTGKGCIYFKNLKGIDADKLKALLKKAYDQPIATSV